VSIALDLKNLPLGERALHVQQTATCEPPTFESAGPHFNPDAKQPLASGLLLFRP